MISDDTKPRSLVTRWQALSWQQRLIVVAVISGFVLINISNFYWQRSTNREILRQQFHLPEAMEFSTLQSNNKPRRLRLVATVQFSPEQFGKYKTALNNSSIWQPVPFHYDGTTFTPIYSSRALRWTNTVPIFAGEKQIYGRHFTYVRPSPSKTQQFFCLAIQKFPGVNLADATKKTEPRYVASACSELTRQDKTLVIMQGTLDDTSQTLHMEIN